MTQKQTELMQKAPPSEVRRIVGELTRQIGLSQEYSSGAGNFVRTQCERFGLSPKVIRSIRGMESMDEGKRQAFIRETLHCWLAMGYFDQVDMFDDVRTSLRMALDAGGEGDASSEAADEEGANPSDEAPEQVTAEGSEAPARKPRRGRKSDPTLDSLVH